MTENGKIKYFLAGIGGIGMSALGRMLIDAGSQVSGIDHNMKSSNLSLLEKNGIEIVSNENDIVWQDIDEVIYSSAIKEESFLLKKAKEKNIPIIKRGDKLASIFNKEDRRIAVTGTHGKTTTTALLSHIFISSGLGTVMYLGGISNNYNENYIKTGTDYYIAEVDESDRTIESFNPNKVLITNIELEHVDKYKKLENIINTFEIFLSNCKKDCIVFYNKHDECITKMINRLSLNIIAINKGISNSKNEICYSWDADFLKGDVRLPNNNIIEIKNKNLFGWHNIENAALAISCAFNSGITCGKIQNAMKSFSGIKRRFEVLTDERLGIILITDYAHHPTEVEKTIFVAREVYKNKKICVVFQPHRFSRFNYFFEDFLKALSNADVVVVSEIYSAGEEGDNQSFPKKMVKRLQNEYGVQSIFTFFDELEDTCEKLKDISVILFLGAGSIDHTARKLAEKYE